MKALPGTTLVGGSQRHPDHFNRPTRFVLAVPVLLCLTACGPGIVSQASGQETDDCSSLNQGSAAAASPIDDQATECPRWPLPAPPRQERDGEAWHVRHRCEAVLLTQRCTESGGTWHNTLQSCACGARELFSARRGCLPAASFWSGQPGLGSKGRLGDFYLRNTVQGEDMAASDLDAARVAALLRGTAVEFLRSPHVPLTFSSQTVAVLKDSLVYLTSEVKQGAGVARKSDLTERPTSPSFSATACAALLRAMAPDKPGEDHSNVCESISQFHRRLVGAGNHEDLALWPKIVGSGDDASTFVLARKDEPSVTLRYVASGTGGVLFHRAILVNHADDLTVAVALGPFGEVLGGRSTIFLLPGPEHDDLLYAKEVYFDAQWVALQAKRLPLGSRREALSLLDHYASRASLAPLPTDGMRAAKPGPIVAMVVEQALDVRDPALVQRLHLDESALIGMTRSRMPTFALSLFGSGRSAPLSLQEFNFPGMSATTSHGALVASVMAADLPDAKIGLLPAGIISQLPAPGGLARAAAIIRAQKPRVVNISMGFSATIPDCEAAFGPLFDQFRDSVAFIVALGNDASSNVADICPAGIGHRFENVITVAGTDHDGDIDRDSNFGASSATVAAPFAPTFRWPLVPATGPPRAGGTSFAAPAVANAALRLLLAQPGLRPSEVKALLMQACAPRDLEVACGGALDLAKLDGLERLLQTTHVEAGEQSTAAP